MARVDVSPKRLNPFERYLSLWVALCMVAGVLIGLAVPGFTDGLRRLEFGAGSQINIPIAILIWLMITPMMMKVDFGSIRNVGRKPKGLFVTLFVNWLVKPFSMAAIARFAPVSMAALLATLVLIFAFQAQNITTKTLHVALIAVPILIQVYFNSSLTYGLMRLFKVEHSIAAPGALIGASNFFELAVATAIALFGPESGAALATVVGVLIEVPVMLSVCSVCNRTRHWFPAPASTH